MGVLRLVRLAVLAGACFTLAACGGDETLLAVDLRTVLAPGVDFVSVRVDLVEARSDGGTSMLRSGVRAARAGEDWRTGFRVAEFTLPRGGDWLVRGELLDAAGSVVASGSVRTAVVEGRANSATLTLGGGCGGEIPCDGGPPDAGPDAGADGGTDAAPPDGAPPDAGRTDAGFRCDEVPVAHTEAACAGSTLACLVGCADDPCFEECLATDPDPPGCARCLVDNLVACAAELGCSDAWVAYSCCRYDNCGSMPTEACETAMCMTERTAWDDCAATYESECTEAAAMCF